jgi:hypothetical protein
MDKAEQDQLRELIEGLREPSPGIERHFCRVMRGEARPASPRECEWYAFWKGEPVENGGLKRPIAVPGITYGICIDCGTEIARQRIDANPMAQRCIPCQERFECDIDIREKDTGGWHGNHTGRTGFSRDDSS